MPNAKEPPFVGARVIPTAAVIVVEQLPTNHPNQTQELDTVSIVSSTEPEWRGPVLESMRKLLSLGPNWNSYGAEPIDRRAVQSALDLLAETMPPTAPAPQVVPSSRGGLQLEWHLRDIELEVLVLPSELFSVCFEDLRSHTIEEQEPGSDAGLLTKALHELTRRAT